MIPQFRVLTKVKKLREERAERALEAARATLRKAVERAEALSAEAEESTRTLGDRERALYDTILKKVVGMGAVDDVKDQVLALMNEHQALLDRRDRAWEHVARCEAKVAEARVELRRRQADVEKIVTITDELVAADLAEKTQKEEIEIEDLFSRPRKPDVEPVAKEAAA
jgi:small-conductance mechanosensitive channel